MDMMTEAPVIVNAPHANLVHHVAPAETVPPTVLLGVVEVAMVGPQAVEEGMTLKQMIRTCPVTDGLYTRVTQCRRRIEPGYTHLACVR
jgi:hypothetical protein